MEDDKIPGKFIGDKGVWNGGNASTPMTDGFSTIESLNENAQTMGLTEGKDVEQDALDNQGIVSYVTDRYNNPL